MPVRASFVSQGLSSPQGYRICGRVRSFLPCHSRKNDAKAGIQSGEIDRALLDARFRGHDNWERAALGQAAIALLRSAPHMVGVAHGCRGRIALRGWFYAWTQEQAELLRRGPAGANRLDVELIAEEIEDLGRSELPACESLCEHIIEHLLKLEYSGLSEPADHWRDGIVEWRLQLERKITRSIAAKLNLPDRYRGRCACCAALIEASQG